MALMVVLQYLQLHLPLPHALAFFLLLFSLFVSKSVATVGSLMGSFFFLFFFFLLLSVLPWSVSLPRSLFGGAGPLLFHGWFSGLVWHENFLAWGLFALLGSILLGGILLGGILLGGVLHRGTLGWCALG